MALPQISPYQGIQTTNPAWNQPIQYSSDFWDQNKPDTAALSAYSGNMGQKGDQAFNTSQGMLSRFNTDFSPGNAAGTMEKWGASYPDIMNAGTKTRLGEWNKYQNANIMNPLQANLKSIAGAGVAAGRGGYGVAGGNYNPEGALQKQAISQVAGGAQQNLQNSMDWMFKAAGGNSQLLQQYLQAYSSMFGQELGAAQGYSGQQRQGLEDVQNAQQNWRGQAGAANENDVNRYNTMLQQLPQNQYAMKQQSQQSADAGYARDQKENDLKQYRDYMNRLNQPAYGGNWGQGDAGMLDYYRTKVGEAQPWARTQSWSNQMSNDNKIQPPPTYVKG